MFTKVFDYNLVEVKRKSNNVIEYLEKYNSEEDKNSIIYVLNSATSNINSISDQEDYLDKVYRKLFELYGLEPHKASIYYIFDRDHQSNSPTIINDLMLKLRNSIDNGEDTNGLLLLSYPSIESLIISCFANNSSQVCVLPKKIKEYLNMKNYYQDQITMEDIKCGCNEFIETIFQLINHQFNPKDLDDFGDINLNIFNHQEAYYKTKQSYVLLSLFLISFIDLGLITIE